MMKRMMKTGYNPKYMPLVPKNLEQQPSQQQKELNLEVVSQNKGSLSVAKSQQLRLNSPDSANRTALHSQSTKNQAKKNVLFKSGTASSQPHMFELPDPKILPKQPVNFKQIYQAYAQRNSVEQTKINNNKNTDLPKVGQYINDGLSSSVVLEEERRR